VVHSTTKYCGGHSDVVGGALVTRTDELGRARSPSCRTPWVPSPVLSTPGPCSRTAHAGLRMERHSDNAELVRRLPEPTTGGQRGHLSRAEQPPRHAGGRAPDAPVRRHGVVPAGRRRAGALDYVASHRVFTLGESRAGWSRSSSTRSYDARLRGGIGA
jgi:cystathionine gamma-synthase